MNAWAARERARREAWLDGPSEEERDAWARGYRRRAAFGLAESRLGPSPDEIDQWAAREHKRREAWLAGPGDDEKREWAQRSRTRSSGSAGEPEPLPTREEIDAWAAQERQRRRAWVSGPSEEEQRQWNRRRTTGLPEERPRWDLEAELGESAQRVLREVELAAKGGLELLFEAPAAVWSYLVRSGRRFEDERYQPPPKARVRF